MQAYSGATQITWLVLKNITKPFAPATGFNTICRRKRYKTTKGKASKRRDPFSDLNENEWKIESTEFVSIALTLKLIVTDHLVV